MLFCATMCLDKLFKNKLFWTKSKWICEIACLFINSELLIVYPIDDIYGKPPQSSPVFLVMDQLAYPFMRIPPQGKTTF